MIEKIVSAGNKIEFTKVSSYKEYDFEEGREDKTVYVSQVFDIIDEYRIKVGVPIVGGRVLMVPQNVRIDVCFFTNRGLYQGRAIVVDRFKEDNVYVMIIEMISELQKYQRRQYFRLNCTMDIMYRKLNDDELAEFNQEGRVKKEIDDGIYYPATALDISGGGIRFLTERVLCKDDIIFVNLHIMYGDAERSYNLAGKVLEVTEAKNRSRFNEVRVEYCNMSGEVREQIIKYIFEQERLMRKKENSL